MKTNNKQRRNQTILFYFVLVYVFAFLFWWTYLLYQKTQEHFDSEVNMQQSTYQLHVNSSIPFEESDTFLAMKKELRKEKTMVVTEGLVFFLLLGFGLIKVRSSFMKDIEIANQQRNFILSITHELKSPLSSIKLMSETLIHRNLEKPMQEKLLRNTLEESNRLETLVENILLAAKIENKQYGFTQEELPLSSMVSTLCEQFAIAKEVDVRTQITPDLNLVGDKSAFSSILINLLENAVKYAPDSEFYEVDLAKEGNKIHLAVKDLGNGIPLGEEDKIFDKFYRIGNEDTRKAKGTGLGLYIVKELVHFHKGEIIVQNNLPNGAVFLATFHV